LILEIGKNGKEDLEKEADEGHWNCEMGWPTRQ
jgi:hypothetical protein